MDVVGRWTKGLLHLMVGGACAALVAWLGYGFALTLSRSDGAVRAATVALILLAVVVVGMLLVAPPVRAAEVALAGTLLDVSLPEPAEASSWESRARGLAWAVVVIVLGGLSLLALLWCLPQGAWLVVAGFTETARADLPPGLARWPRPLLVFLGVGLAAAGVLVQPLLVGLLERLAPRTLGSTAGDLLVHAERERRRLLEVNDLARELHDSVGHALTAIGVQAEAGARVAGQDPDYARQALRRIADTTQRAVAELDDVLGTLRAGAGAGANGAGAGLEDVVELVGELGPRGSGLLAVEQTGEVDRAVARTTYRVLQEALTNARRHGSGEPRGHVRVADGRVQVLIENAVDSSAGGAGERSRGGLGLVGMRERVALARGTLQYGPVAAEGAEVWRLEAELPAVTEGERR